MVSMNEWRDTYASIESHCQHASLLSGARGNKSIGAERKMYTYVLYIHKTIHCFMARDSGLGNEDRGKCKNY